MKNFKFVWLFVLAMVASFSALAEDQGIQAFVGAGVGQWTLVDESGASTSFVAGVQIHKGTSIEVEHAEADGFTQDTLRIVGNLVDIGPVAMTLQLSGSNGQVDVPGFKANDTYFGAGLGFQYDMGDHVTVRLMHNVYFLGEFAGLGVDLGRGTDTSLGLAYRF